MPTAVVANNYKHGDEIIGQEALSAIVEPFIPKLAWFKQNGYTPHYYQTLFHCMRTGDHITRFRHLVAGRRGGKTLSAAWEVLFYCLHPEFFHLDAHGVQSNRPLWVWALAKSHTLGNASLLTFREVIAQVGLVHNKDYRENRGDKFFEFLGADGQVISRVDFRSAEYPESLRGAGLDILWIDEAAHIPTEDAYIRVRPALSDKRGIVITTTTPIGKNWLYDRFWSDEAFADPENGRVEYWSIDNPVITEDEWLTAQKELHPAFFKQEYCAAFDSMAGVELLGDWLHYYELNELPVGEDGKYDLRFFIGVDPAISIRDTADRFCMSLVGVDKMGMAYLIEQYVDRIQFPDQVDKINEWHLRFRPEVIGIESQAYQAALAQQVGRLNSFPPVIEIQARGKKSERILAMSPLFRIAKVRVRRNHIDFISEWIDYDSTMKNPKDDTLDSMEIALRTAGALMPEALDANQADFSHMPPITMDELAQRSVPGSEWGKQQQYVDDMFGGEW